MFTFTFVWGPIGSGIIIPFLPFSFLSAYLLQVDPCVEGGLYGLGCSPLLRLL